MSTAESTPPTGQPGTGFLADDAKPAVGFSRQVPAGARPGAGVQGRKAAMLTAERGRSERDQEIRALLETALEKLGGGGP